MPTATENAAPAVENTENETPVAEEAKPVLASLDQADPFSQATVPVLVQLINAYNEIATKNASKTKGVDEIAADLAETSTDPKVVALRAKRDEIQEQISKSVLEQAKAMKAESGEPDIEAEKSAADAVRGLEKALATFPNGKDVSHFLPTKVPGTVTRIGGTSNVGPTRDLTVVREWARKNGFPEVKDRGRMSEDIMEAFTKANPGVLK